MRILLLMCALCAPIFAQQTLWINPNQIQNHSFKTHKKTYTAYTLGNVNGAPWEIQNVDMPIEMKPAFDAAILKWQEWIQSPQPIKIRVEMADLATEVLAGTDYQLLLHNGYWYPSALGKQLTTMPAVADTMDMVLYLNRKMLSNGSMYFGTEAKPDSEQFDFMTLIIHEITHGLGFAGSLRTFGGLRLDDNAEDAPCLDMEGSACFGFKATDGMVYPMKFDSFLYAGTELLTQKPNPSIALHTALITGLKFGGTNASAVIRDKPQVTPSLYTPPFYAKGSSVNHWHTSINDWNTGQPNHYTVPVPETVTDELMYATQSKGIVVRSLGHFTCGMLQDLGWNTTTQCGKYARFEINWDKNQTFGDNCLTSGNFDKLYSIGTDSLHISQLGASEFDGVFSSGWNLFWGFPNDGSKLVVESGGFAPISAGNATLGMNGGERNNVILYGEQFFESNINHGTNKTRYCHRSPQAIATGLQPNVVVKPISLIKGTNKTIDIALRRIYDVYHDSTVVSFAILPSSNVKVTLQNSCTNTSWFQSIIDSYPGNPPYYIGHENNYTSFQEECNFNNTDIIKASIEATESSLISGKIQVNVRTFVIDKSFLMNNALGLTNSEYYEIRVETLPLCGDANMDGLVTEQDVSFVADALLNGITLTPYQLWAANPSGNAHIGGTDIGLLFRKARGGPGKWLCIEPEQGLQKTQDFIQPLLGANNFSLTYTTYQYEHGASPDKPVIDVNVQSLGKNQTETLLFTLESADPNILEFIDLAEDQTGTLAELAFKKIKKISDRKMTLLISSAKPLIGSGALVRLKGKSLMPGNVQISSSPITVGEDRPTVAPPPPSIATISNSDELPKEGLDLVYPNPLQGELKVQYALADNADISLCIYNVLGQQIKCLINGFETAGRHERSWDMRGLSNGIYWIWFKTHNQIYKQSFVKIN